MTTATRTKAKAKVKTVEDQARVEFKTGLNGDVSSVVWITDTTRDEVSVKALIKRAYWLCAAHFEKDWDPAVVYRENQYSYNRSLAREMDIHDQFLYETIRGCKDCLGPSAAAYRLWYTKQGKMKIRMPQPVRYEIGRFGEDGDRALWERWQTQAGVSGSVPLSWASPEVVEMVEFNKTEAVWRAVAS